MAAPERDLQREAVCDLVGALAYGELTAFTRLAADARLAPTLSEEVSMAGFAARRFDDYSRLADHLTALGIHPEVAMSPFVAPLDAFHDLTEPGDWLEGLVKAYVGDGIARDFYREMSTLLDDNATVQEPATSKVVAEVLAEQTSVAEFLVSRVRAGIEADPAKQGRLALWARRLVGEALSQTQHAAVERDALLELVGEHGDLTDLVGLLTRVTDAHGDRMTALGLAG